MFTQYGLEGTDGIVAELTRRLDSMEDFVGDTRLMGFHVDGADTDHDELAAIDGGSRAVTLTLDDAFAEGRRVNDHAQGQIAGRLRVPRPMFDRLRDEHPDILKDLVGKLFVREPEKRMLRTLDGNVRAFLSNKYRRLDNYDLMERSILPALGDLGDRMQIQSLGLTDTRMYVKFIFPELTVNLGGSDLSAGLAVSNSEVGAGALAVEPFVYTWICTNGMIMGVRSLAEFGLRKYHVGRTLDEDAASLGLFSDRTLALDDEAFFSAVYDLVKNASSGIQFAEIASRLRELAETDVVRKDESATLVVERLGKAHQLRETEQANIMQHLIAGGDLSAWGFVSAVTRAAQDAGDYDRATELERIGGKLTEMRERDWRALAKA